MQVHARYLSAMGSTRMPPRQGPIQRPTGDLPDVWDDQPGDAADFRACAALRSGRNFTRRSMCIKNSGLGFDKGHHGSTRTRRDVLPRVRAC